MRTQPHISADTPLLVAGYITTLVSPVFEQSVYNSSLPSRFRMQIAAVCSCNQQTYQPEAGAHVSAVLEQRR